MPRSNHHPGKTKGPVVPYEASQECLKPSEERKRVLLCPGPRPAHGAAPRPKPPVRADGGDLRLRSRPPPVAAPPKGVPQGRRPPPELRYDDAVPPQHPLEAAHVPVGPGRGAREHNQPLVGHMHRMVAMATGGGFKHKHTIRPCMGHMTCEDNWNVPNNGILGYSPNLRGWKHLNLTRDGPRDQMSSQRNTRPVGTPPGVRT